MPDSNAPVNLDVAIVGAGVSGVYAGWRLLEAASSSKGADVPASLSFSGAPAVAVFEGSKRVGGRLLSVQPPGMPNTWCELGGMRYLSSQPLVRSLVENKLGLPTKPFAVDEPENINYVRGRRLRNRELIDPKLVPYDLDWSEQGMEPGDLIGHAVNQLIPGVSKMSGAELRHFLDTFLLEGRHVFDWGFWNLLARGMSQEAYEFARDTSGYDTPSLNWNAADTISLNFDFEPGVKFKSFEHGYQSLPLKLAEEFGTLGGTIHLEHRLVSVDGTELEDGSSGVLLTFAAAGNDDPSDRVEVRARAAVLAMPRRSLELLEPTGPVLGDPTLRANLRSVTPIPLFKLCIAYPFPWWEAVGVTRGRSKTDLPVRQLYYWGSEPAGGNDPAMKRSALMATYDDGENTMFWSGLADAGHLDLFETKLDKRTNAQTDSQEWDNYRATRAMVAEADRQLKLIHDLRYAPEPYAAAFADWTVDPYGGGVNFWNVHVQSSRIISFMTHPVAAMPVYICGEAYSNGQGWVEGALETAELVLQSQLGLNPPGWVTAS